jgi:hypothetical protein
VAAGGVACDNTVIGCQVRVGIATRTCLVEVAPQPLLSHACMHAHAAIMLRRLAFLALARIIKHQPSDTNTKALHPPAPEPPHVGQSDAHLLCPYLPTLPPAPPPLLSSSACRHWSRAPGMRRTQPHHQPQWTALPGYCRRRCCLWTAHRHAGVGPAACAVAEGSGAAASAAGARPWCAEATTPSDRHWRAEQRWRAWLQPKQGQLPRARRRRRAA